MELPLFARLRANSGNLVKIKLPLIKMQEIYI